MEFWTFGWNELSFWWSSRNFWILSYAASRGLASQFSALSLSWCRRWCAHLLTPVGLTQVADSGGFSPQKLLGQSGDHGLFWLSGGSLFQFFLESFFPLFFLGEIWGNDEIHLRLAHILFHHQRFLGRTNESEILRHLELMQLQCPVLSNSEWLNFWPEIWYASSTESWFSGKVSLSMKGNDHIGDTPHFPRKTMIMGGRVDFVCIVSRRTKTCDSQC